MQRRALKEYPIDKLYGKARAAAIEACHDINVEDREWWEAEYEYWTKELREEGFEEVEICFSGFWCQGDGASFTAERVNLSRFLHAENRWKPEYRLLEVAEAVGSTMDIKVVRRDSHYVHQYTVDPEFWGGIACDGLMGHRISQMLGEIEKLMKERVVELCNAIYKSLEKEYDYLVSDAVVMETIEANDYMFNYKGEQI